MTAGRRSAPAFSGRKQVVGSSARKILPLGRLVRVIARAQRRGRRAVFTNGCFDLLHAGHVAVLERARRAGDLLVVAINSDRSVRGLKGRGRPITPASDPAAAACAILEEIRA